MRKVLFTPITPAFKHRFYLSQERIPTFQHVFREAKSRGYFKDLSIDDIKYGVNIHVVCTSISRMNESTLIFVFDMCNGYELNTPIMGDTTIAPDSHNQSS